MINVAISQKHNDFLWLNYYERFVQMICENIDTTKLNGEEKISEFPTYNHRLIYDIIDNTIDWLKFVDENYFEDCISPSILTSLFSSLSYLAESSNFDITEQFRSKRFESAICIYFDVNEQIQNQYSEAIISRFDRRSESFKDLIGTAWESVVDDKWAGRPFDHEIPDVEKYIRDVIEKLDISTQFRGDWLKTN